MESSNRKGERGQQTVCSEKRRMRKLRRKAKRMWAYLLVLLLLFSVAGGSGFPVLAETEHIEDVSTEAENMETAEMEAGETEAEEKAGKQDEQAEE